MISRSATYAAGAHDSTASSFTATAGNRHVLHLCAAGAPPGPLSTPSNEVALVVGCTTPPAQRPTRLTATLNGLSVTLEWNAPLFTPVSGYVLEAGSEPLVADAASITVTGTRVAVAGVAPGTWYLRVRAISAAGLGRPAQR